MKINVKIQEKTFSVEIDDIHARPIQANVDGEIFEVWPEEENIITKESISAPITPQVSTPVAPVHSNAESKACRKRLGSDLVVFF